MPFFTLISAGLASGKKWNGSTRWRRRSELREWRARCRVAVPLLLDRASTNLALFFMAVTGSFEIPLLLGPQSPQMITVLAWRRFGRFDLTEKPQAFIVALLYTGLVVVLLLIFLRRRPGASTL